MPDVQEVFRVATQKIRPEPGFVDRQFESQRRRTRTRRNGAIALVIVLGLTAVVVAIRALEERTGPRPAGQGNHRNGVPSAESIPLLSDGTLEPGRDVFTSFDPGLDASHRITIDVPDGSVGSDGWAAVKAGTDQTGVATVANIGDIYADACRWKGTQLDRSAISSADGLATALAGQAGLRVSTPTDVTVDGLAGTYMERRVPAPTDTSACDEGEFRVYRYTDGGKEGPRARSAHPPVGPRRRWRPAIDRGLARAGDVIAGPGRARADGGVHPDRPSVERRTEQWCGPQ